MLHGRASATGGAALAGYGENGKKSVDNGKKRDKITLIWTTAVTKSAADRTQSEEGTVQALRETACGSRFRAGLRRVGRPIPDTG